VERRARIVERGTWNDMMTLDVLRSTLNDLRSKFHDSRFTFHDSYPHPSPASFDKKPLFSYTSPMKYSAKNTIKKKMYFVIAIR
jgi:hypothetical protein